MTKNLDLRPGEWRVKGWKRTVTRTKPLLSQFALVAGCLFGVFALVSVVGAISQWGSMPPQAATQSLANVGVMGALAFVSLIASAIWRERRPKQEQTVAPPPGGLSDAWVRRMTTITGVWAACVLQFYPSVHHALGLPGWLGLPLMALPGFGLFLYVSFTD